MRKKDNGDGAVVEEAQASIDTIREAFNTYRELFGVDAAMEDGPKILARIFGEDIEQIKQIPVDDPGKLAETVAQVKRAIASNEFDRKPCTGVSYSDGTRAERPTPDLGRNCWIAGQDC